METRIRQGIVRDADGRPVAEALVVVESGSAPTPEIGIVADAEGRFRLALPDGSFRVGARGPDGAYGWCEVEGGDEGPVTIEVRAPD